MRFKKVKKIKRIAFISLLFSMFCVSGVSQSLDANLTLNLNPYPSPYISDWENNPTAVGQAIIQDNSGSTRQVTLFVQLIKSGEGLLVDAESQSINVDGFSSRILNNTEFIGFSTATYQNMTVRERVFRTGRLPAGVYTACAVVRDQMGNNISRQACQEFEIVYPDPPQLIYPDNEMELTTEYPTFQWIPSDIPADYTLSYSMKIVEVLEGQALLRALEANIPLFEQDGISGSNLSYPIEARAFEEGKTYAWRVQALDQYGLIPTSNQGYSEIFTFSVPADTSSEDDETVVERATESEPCGGECMAEEPSGSPSGNSFSAGDELQIGQFVLNLTEVSGTGMGLSGAGEILVPFLNDIRISVQFDDLEVNDAGVVIGGNAHATEDIPDLTYSDVSSTIGSTPVSVPSPTSDEAEAFSDVFEGGERLVSGMTGDRAMGMPLGMSSNGTAGVGYTVGITTMQFGPRRASLNALLTFDIPSLGDKMIALGSNDICFTPGGLGEEGNLYLANDWEIVQEGGIRFALKGLSEASGDTSDVTYAKWDCEGFDCINVRGAVEFPEEKLIKENEMGAAVGGPVTGDISFKTCDGNNFLAQIDMDPFQVSGIPGWGFSVEDAWLDFSDTENPTDFTLPENYEDPSLSDPRLETAWTGFYLKLAQLRSPGAFYDQSRDSEGGRGQVSVRNLIIDGTGVTASINAENLIDYDDGNVKGWAFSLDTVSINILQNSFESGRLSGGLGLPISEDQLGYSTTLSLSEDDNFHYDFIIAAGASGYNVNAWKASLNLDEGSNITFEYNEGAEEEVTLHALLHGNLNINAGNLGSIPGISFNGIEFQNLYIGTEDPYFNVGDTGVDGNVFGLASPQKKMITTAEDDDNGSTGGFPVTVDNIGLAGGPSNPGLEFTTNIILVDQVGFAASFTLTIYGELSLPSGRGDRFSFGYDRTRPGSISIEIPDFKGFSLSGTLNFYGDAGSTRKGVSGTLEVGVPMGLTVDLQADFGRTTPAHREGEFSFWYINGLVTFSGGIDLFSGFALYGFGGGVYHHMSGIESSYPAEKNSMIPSDIEGGDGEESSSELVAEGGVHDMEATRDTFLGFKIKAVMGLKGEPKSFNMNIALTAEIGEGSTGLQYMSIDGEGYVMRDIEETEGTGKVWADVELDLVLHDPEDPGKKFFTGSFDIFVKVDNDLFYLRGPPKNDYLFTETEFYADNDGKWYLHMPPPQGDKIRRNKLEAGIDVKLAEIQLDFNSYLLIGHEIPTGLPPLPDKIADVLGVPQYGDKGSTTNTASDRGRAATMRANKMDDFATGKGFATGVMVDFRTRFDFAIFYAKLWLQMGFDMSFLKVNVPCAENPGGGVPGVNGFYAQGQVYAGLYGEVGIHVDLFFINKDIPIIGLGAAFALQGKFPNPSWFQGRVGLTYTILGGLISGTTRFKVEMGQECTLVENMSPFGDMEFVESVEPSGEDVSVYADPAAFFNLPVGEYIEIPADEGGDEVYTYEAFIDSFNLTNKDTNEPVTNTTTVISEDHYSARLIPNDYLAGDTDFDAEITISTWEHFPDKPKEKVYMIKDGRPQVWEEIKNSEFVTEPEPNTIEELNVAYTYPVERQNYFLQGHTIDDKGLIKFASGGVGNLFDGSIDINQDGYESPLTENIGEYVARFTQVESREETEVELDYTSGNQLYMPIPELENGKHYSVQIIAKVQPDISALGSAYSAVDLAGSLFNQGYTTEGVQNYFDENDLDFDALQEDVTRGRFMDIVHEDFAQSTVDSMGVTTDSYQSTVEVDFTNRLGDVTFVAPETLPGGDKVNDGEHLLYDFYFRTSKFNTLEEKLSGVELDASHYPEYDGYLFYFLSNYEGFDMHMELEEPFDEFDLYGLTKEVVGSSGGEVSTEMERTLGPLVHIHSDRSNEYFEEKATKIYDLFRDLKNLKDKSYSFDTGDGDYYQPSWPLKCMPLIGTFDGSDPFLYGNTIDREEALSGITIEDDSDIPDPLPTWALENAAGINQSPPVSSSPEDSEDETTGGQLELSPSGDIAGGTITSNPYVSGFLNGSFDQVSFQTNPDYHIELVDGGEPSGAIYDLYLFYDVANEVHDDAEDLKMNVSGILDEYEADPVYPFFELINDNEIVEAAKSLDMYYDCRRSGFVSEYFDYFWQKYEACKDAWYCDHKTEGFISSYRDRIAYEDYPTLTDAYELLNDEWEFSLPRGTYNINFNYHFPGSGDLGRADFYESVVNKSFEY